MESMRVRREDPMQRRMDERVGREEGHWTGEMV